MRSTAIALSLLATAAWAAPKEWTNSTDSVSRVLVSPAPKNPVSVEVGRDGRLLRTLPFATAEKGITVLVPPFSRAQLWEKSELVKQPDASFATAARYGLFPQITVGPVIVDNTILALPKSERPWETGPARFRVYPEGRLPVTVMITNEGRAVVKNPRIRLFVPDNWKTSPEIAPVTTADAKPIKSLGPGAIGMATFTVRISGQTPLGSRMPLIAFLRFDSGAGSVTVHNSVEVTLEEPLERRYSMTEKGDKFIVRLIDHFPGGSLGTPNVEVRQPVGTKWNITPPEPVEVKADVDARAPVSGVQAPADQIAVPVVVTLNGFRMGYTPVVCVTDDFTTSTENGLKRLAASSPTSSTSDGLTFANQGDDAHILALDVAPKFAVSDPASFVSPAWVTVRLIPLGVKRIRLEYDNWDRLAPASVAGDLPVTSESGQEQVFSFLVPDAQFAGRLPGSADLRLILTGGNATIRSISVTKWNPLKVQ